jgi:predicted amidohydrolase
MVEGFRVSLLKQASGNRRKRSSLWTRTRSTLAGSTAGLLKASFRKAFVGLLRSDPLGLASAYTQTFAELARTYQVTIVAGSAYLPDGDGTIRHTTAVFGPDGSVLGRHDKTVLAADDEGLATAGDHWAAISTPAGRIGVLLGEEVLYPEIGRALAYEEAELLVTLAAVESEALAAYIRQATVARAQENQCFAMTTFLIGSNYLAPTKQTAMPFLGKSGIYAPLEMTPHYTGVLVEMGTASSEGLLTAELDRDQLLSLWTSGVHPVRRAMPVDLLARHLPEIYSRRALAGAHDGTATTALALSLPGAEEGTSPALLDNHEAASAEVTPGEGADEEMENES